MNGEEDTQEQLFPPAPTPEPPAPKEAAPQPGTLLHRLREVVGDDVLQLFGDTGTGKSTLAWELARSTLATGHSVYYLDTERNLSQAHYAALGSSYEYTPRLTEIVQRCRKLPRVDLVVLDSIGFPILVEWARLSMRQKGDALLYLIQILGDLKVWAYQSKGMVLVTNQPESMFGKEAGYERRPFGDKGQYACKEIWWTEKVEQTPDRTDIRVVSFRSRELPKDRHILSMRITTEAVKVAWKLS